MFDDDEAAATTDGPTISNEPTSVNYRPKESRRRSGTFVATKPDEAADATVLASFLAVVLDGQVAINLADELVHVFGGFAEVIAAPVRDLKAVCGSAKEVVPLLKSLADVAMRLSRAELLSRPAFRSARDLFPYLTASLGRERVKCVQILYLNAKNRLIGDEILVRGDVHGAPIKVATIVRAALLNHAAAVVLAHNHPSGDRQPSRGDIDLTEKFRRALSSVEINLHDHIIVSRQGCTSLRQLGMWPATG
jgi:DNA repair protein RadC